MSLLDDLKAASEATSINRVCPVCRIIQTTEDVETREALIAAAAGSIGRDKFVSILQIHCDIAVGKRTVQRHRQEGHKP